MLLTLVARGRQLAATSPMDDERFIPRFVGEPGRVSRLQHGRVLPRAWRSRIGSPSEGGRCLVVDPCRSYALAHPGELGVWGGMTEAERCCERRRDGGGQAA
jgi:hypothetical protein